MCRASTYWGFYFAYSPNKTVEEARAGKLSQDLILATEQLGAAVDTATLSCQATPDCAVLAERYFYTLYLTRILVLSRFLDCLPRDVPRCYAPTLWAMFQHDPPRMPDGDDVFAKVYRHVTSWDSPTFDLKRTAEAHFTALITKNERLFSRPGRDKHEGLNSRFYLVVNEVEAPVSQAPSSGRRPACSRHGVSTLFYGFDKPE